VNKNHQSNRVGLGEFFSNAGISPLTPLTVQNHFASPETRDTDQHRRGQDCDQIN
jgi:hypothetical protein